MELPLAASWVMNWAKRQVSAKRENRGRAMEVGLEPVATLAEAEISAEAEIPVEAEISAVVEVTLGVVEVTSAEGAVEISNTT